jgi:hypothetical protein
MLVGSKHPLHHQAVESALHAPESHPAERGAGLEVPAGFFGARLLDANFFVAAHARTITRKPCI